MQSFNQAGLKIDVKRFYLAIPYEVPCPLCGTMLKWSDHDYLSYPTVGEGEEHSLYCQKCDENGNDSNPIKLIVKINMTVEIEKKD